jgi:hypothetical protein
VFCYNCGERVRADEAIAAATTPVEKIEPVPASRPPLRSAASLRKQRRAYNRQPVEITMGAAEQSSGRIYHNDDRSHRGRIGFIAACFILALKHRKIFYGSTWNGRMYGIGRDDRAADAMVKAANVKLVGYEKVDAGLVTAIVRAKSAL